MPNNTQTDSGPVAPALPDSALRELLPDLFARARKDDPTAVLFPVAVADGFRAAWGEGESRRVYPTGSYGEFVPLTDAQAADPEQVAEAFNRLVTRMADRVRERCEAVLAGGIPELGIPAPRPDAAAPVGRYVCCRSPMSPGCAPGPWVFWKPGDRGGWQLHCGHDGGPVLDAPAEK